MIPCKAIFYGQLLPITNQFFAISTGLTMPSAYGIGRFDSVTFRSCLNNENLTPLCLCLRFQRLNIII